MHVISPKKLREFWARHADSESALRAWDKITSMALWANFAEVRADFSHADQVGTCVVFNIGGNKYRLIARVFYARGEFKGRVYILHVLTHRIYDDGGWKKDCDC
jgi:mRNA interferase HigB